MTIVAIIAQRRQRQSPSVAGNPAIPSTRPMINTASGTSSDEFGNSMKAIFEIATTSIKMLAIVTAAGRATVAGAKKARDI
jgi:hypothetical protein